MTELDPIDLHLLALLQQDASRSNLALAEGLVSEFICAAGAALRSVRHGSRPQKRPSVTDGSRAGCKCSRKPNQGLPSVEVLFALMARTDDEHQFGRTNVEPQDVTSRAKRDDQFAKCRA